MSLNENKSYVKYMTKKIILANKIKYVDSQVSRWKQNITQFNSVEDDTNNVTTTTKSTYILLQ